MRKKTLSIILDAIIGILVVSIILLIVMIGKRGAKPMEEAQEEAAAPEAVVAAVTTETEEAVSPDAEEESVERVLYATPDVEDSLSVRAGAGTNYDKIDKARPGEALIVLEVVDQDWTKIDYHGREGYVNNAYLKFFYEITDADGIVTREDVDFSEITEESGSR